MKKIYDSLLNAKDLPEYLGVCGVDEEKYANCKEYNICKSVAEVVMKEFFPGNEMDITLIKWGDCKAAWLLDNGYVIALKEEDCVKKEKMYIKQALNVKRASFDPDTYFVLFHATNSLKNKYIVLLIPGAFVEGNSFDEVVNFLSKKSEEDC